MLPVDERRRRYETARHSIESSTEGSLSRSEAVELLNAAEAAEYELEDLRSVHAAAGRRIELLVTSNVELDLKLNEAAQRNEANHELRNSFLRAESSKQLAEIRAAELTESRDMIFESRQQERATVRALTRDEHVVSAETMTLACEAYRDTPGNPDLNADEQHQANMLLSLGVLRVKVSSRLSS